MQALFENLTNAVSASWFIAIPAAMLWGVLSILLSPCHLASIPLIIGFIDEQGRISVKRAFFVSLLFSVGILFSIAVIGVITAAAGRMIGDLGGWTNYFVAAIFFGVGLHLLGVVPMPFSGPGKIGFKRKGVIAAFLLGLIFGIALGPCTFAYMAPVLGVAFSAADKNMIYGMALVLAYAIGHCSVIVFAGTFTEKVQWYMDFNEKSKVTIITKKICGLLILVAGLYMLYIAK